MFSGLKKFFMMLTVVLSLPALSLPAPALAASVYETQAEFLNRAFSGSPPGPAITWLSGEGRSAWVLDEIGKELPITVGVVIEKDYINNLRVLTYRENRGGEVATPAFTDQFNHVALQNGGALDANIDGISGATLSVQALTRLATVALFLHSNTGCKDGA